MLVAARFIRRPERRLAAAGGITITTTPPGLVWARACWIQASSDFRQKPTGPTDNLRIRAARFF
jgi:hypothetical protein